MKNSTVGVAVSFLLIASFYAVEARSQSLCSSGMGINWDYCFVCFDCNPIDSDLAPTDAAIDEGFDLIVPDDDVFGEFLIENPNNGAFAKYLFDRESGNLSLTPDPNFWYEGNCSYLQVCNGPQADEEIQ